MAILPMGRRNGVDEVDNLVSFDKVYIFDPVHHKWYSQTTTGTVPGSRYRFCSITDSDREGTIELFVFGGSPGITVSQAGSQQQLQTQAMDEVYVLSFPSFNWQKADYSPTWPRIGHSCAQNWPRPNGGDRRCQSCFDFGGRAVLHS